MIFSKSITFDEEELKGVGLTAGCPSSHSDVEELFIEKLRSGDARAFDTLVDRYGGHVYGLLLRITNDPEEAEDLTQETFLRALKGIGKFRGEAGIRTWLFRIAINQSKNRFRWWKRRKREKTVSIDAPAKETGLTFSDGIADAGPSPEDDVLRNERRRNLLSAIESLPETYREAVVLCDIEGLSYEEISNVLDIGMGTVKSRIARGRRELRSKLSDI
ncbi:MAG: sigma-70 family RNA polymerase sigma factor [Acidobacteriota bacterium]|nr:sigma-70 family RNA polymerase sigma factor [Acidobacteriota bacterium]